MAVIGLGRFGVAMAEELTASGVEVLAIDTDPDVVQQYDGQFAHVVRADASNIEALFQLGVQDFPNAVVAIGQDLAASILVASALIKLDGPEIWAKASTSQQGEILTQMGIRHVFHPEQDMGRRAAHLLTHSLSDYFDLGHGFAMATAEVPANMDGRSIAELKVRRVHGVTVVGVRVGPQEWVPAKPDTVLRQGQTVLVAGMSHKLDLVFKEF